MAEATPRIHAEYLGNFIGQTVRILGKVTSLRGDQATIEAHGSVICTLNRDNHLTLNNYVEIVGKVESDFSIKVFVATDFGRDIDTTMADAVVEATLKHSSIFYTSEET